jgi:hypothetical protein
MNYIVEMMSGVRFRLSNLVRHIRTYAQTAKWSLKPTLFIQNEGSKLGVVKKHDGFTCCCYLDVLLKGENTKVPTWTNILQGIK